MIIVTILLCLLIQRLANIGRLFNNDMLEVYLKKLHPFIGKLTGWLVLPLSIVPFILILLILSMFLHGKFMGIASLVLSSLVLFVCVDMRDMKNILANYFNAMDKEELNDAVNAVGTFVNEPIKPEEVSLRHVVAKTIFMRCFEYIFAPIFWFILFDIYGVALYCLVVGIRSVALKADTMYSGLANAASRVQMILNWVPMRLVALTYPLSGNFMKGFSYSYKKVLSASCDTEDFVVNAGFEALNSSVAEEGKKEDIAVISLVDRTFFIWVAAVALFYLGKLFT